MATEDRNGCLHGDDDGKFVPKDKAYDSRDDFKELKKRVNNSKKTKRLTSAVINKYSSVRKMVETIGYSITYVNDGTKSYLVKINKSADDFDYDIISEGEYND